jgi:hypothetical protein
MKRIVQKFLILVWGIVFTIPMYAQSFSSEFQAAYDKYTKVAAISTDGTVYADSFIQKQVNRSKAKLACAKKAVNLLEMLATIEMTGGSFFLFGHEEDKAMTAKGRELVTLLGVYDKRIDSIFSHSTVLLNAIKKINSEMVFSVGLDWDEDAYPKYTIRLRKQVSEYDNATLALYLFLVSDEVDDFMKPGDLALVCKRFDESHNPYLQETGRIYTDIYVTAADDEE